jgi:hypothetical protein
MKLVEFKGGQLGARILINPDNVCSISESVTLVDDAAKLDPTMTEISTADGKSLRVQGSIDDVSAALSKDP